MSNYIKAFVGVLLLSGFVACRPAEKGLRDTSDQILAQVYNRVLYLSDMDGMFPENGTQEDSSMIINTFMEKWVRDNVLMHEAERNIPKDLNIDALVRDYRSSLIRHNFEKNMVDILLDSIITQEQLSAYYENNREQYHLPSTILRCHLIKVPKSSEDLSKLKQFWASKKEEDYQALLEYCTSYADVYMLEDSTWYKVEDIALQLPQGTLTPGNIQSSKEITLEDKDHRYFFRILETVESKEIAPLSYIKDQAKKVILHNRKIRLLEEKRQEMYERELRRNNVKFFVQK